MQFNSLMDANQLNHSTSDQPAGLSALSVARTCMPTRSLSLVLPAFNEQETIAQAIREADEGLSALAIDYEILVVDDGSTDATFEIASELAQSHPAVKVLRQPRNLGYGAALRRGFAHARGTLLAFTDADCQFDLREMDRLMLLAKDYEIVCGYRIDRKDDWRRRFYSSVFNHLTQFLLGTRVRDCDCAFKLMHREVLTQIPMASDGFFFNAELLAKARQQEISLVEVGVTHRPRAAGESKVSLRHVLPVLAALLSFWWQSVLFPTSFQEASKQREDWSKQFEWGAGLLLVLVTFLLLFSRLSYPLIDPDETRYAQIAYEMVESGDWITPTLEGEPYLDKPPLLYWATASSYKLFGVNETAARLPCAMAVFLTVLLTFWLGKRLVGSKAAWCAAVALLLCGGFVIAGRFIIMDGLLTLFCFVASVGGFLACRSSTVHLGWWLTSAIACGLGVLTKGPIAIVLCLPPLLVACWLSNQQPRILMRHWAMMAGIICLLNAPWFIAVSLADQQFPLYFFWKHNIVRFVHTFHHQQAWWFYLPVLFIAMFPVSLLLPALASFLFARRAKTPCPRTPELGFLFLSAAWVVFFFSLSSCKLPPYVLPAFPPLCLLIGSMLSAVVFTPETQAKLTNRLQRMPKQIGAMLAGLLILAAGVDLVLFQTAISGRLLVGTVFVTAVVGLVAFLRTRSARSPAIWGYSVCLGLALSAFFFQELLPAFSRERSIHGEVAQQFQRHEQTPVLYFDRRTYSAVFHLSSSRIVKFDSSQLKEAGQFLQSHPEVILVTTPDSADLLRKSFGTTIELTARTSDGTLYLTHTRKLPAIRLGVNDTAGRR